MGTGRHTTAIVLAAILAPPAAAVAAREPATPIPEGPDAGSLTRYTGAPATPDPLRSPQPPPHPFMAPNGASNIHVDAYQTDTNTWQGPLGRDMQRVDTFQIGDCGSVTFDREGRIISVCVGVQRPTLVMFDPKTLDRLASMPLPPRQIGVETLSLFNSFGGGGYFYLDNRDRAVVPTTSRHIYVVGQTTEPAFRLERDYDLSGEVESGDTIFSALPDWSGLIWFVTARGLVGTIDPASGRVAKLALAGEEIANSFAVDETGGVYVVSDKALYRFDATASGAPAVTWREVYPNSGISKPGQVNAGSGTTPTLMGERYVSITDNADPMDVVVYRRERQVAGSRQVCAQPVFSKGASASDNSLIGTDTAMVVENNYGYTGPLATEFGRTTTPGIERVDIDADGRGCHTVWKSGEISPTVVPKLSLGNGLVYVYTNSGDPGGNDAWYLTALDFRTGKTRWKSLGGEGLGHNNNYAPVTLGTDGTAYVGVLGGLVALRDKVPPGPPPPVAVELSLSLRYRARRDARGRRCARGVVLARLRGQTADVRRVDFSVGRRPAGADLESPYAQRIGVRLVRRGRRAVVRATARFNDATAATRSASFRRC